MSETFESCLFMGRVRFAFGADVDEIRLPRLSVTGAALEDFHNPATFQLLFFRFISFSFQCVLDNFSSRFAFALCLALCRLCLFVPPSTLQGPPE